MQRRRRLQVVARARSAASPIRYAARQRSATASRRPSKPPPLRLPPRISVHPALERLDAHARAEATLVAFESFTYSTPPRSPTSSSRCGTPANVAQRPRAPRRPARPRASAAAAAAIAFSQVVRAAQADLVHRQRLVAPQLPAGAARRRADPKLRPGGAKPGQRRVAAPSGCANSAQLRRRGRRSKVPWRSRWSSLEVQQHRALGGERRGVLELEARAPRRRSTAAASTAPTSEASGVPTLPATATGRPASRWIAPSSSVVVVLPLVPVTATNAVRAAAARPARARRSPRSRARSAQRDHRRLLRARRGSSPRSAHAVEQVDAVACPGAPRRPSSSALRRPPESHADHLAVRRAASAPRRGPSAPAPPPGTGPAAAVAAGAVT